MNRRCADCIWCIPRNDEPEVSECHRMPPTPVNFPERGRRGEQDNFLLAVFPPVQKTDWCGEFESKIV